MQEYGFSYVKSVSGSQNPIGLFFQLLPDLVQIICQIFVLTGKFIFINILIH